MGYLRLLRLATCLGSLLGAAACASVSATTSTTGTVADYPVPPATVSIFPLDHRKVYDPVYTALAASLAADLKAEGFVVEPQFTSPGSYMILIDYATSIGIQSPLDRYTTLIVYNTSTHQKVFQQDAEAGDFGSSITKVDSALLKHASKDLVNHKSRDGHVRIYTQN